MANALSGLCGIGLVPGERWLRAGERISESQGISPFQGRGVASIKQSGAYRVRALELGAT